MVDFSQYLDFEKPVVEIELELQRLKSLVESGDTAHINEVEKLQKKRDKVRSEVYGNLKPYQQVRLSRHFERPFTLDYIGRLITDFSELHGDRKFGDDHAMVGGLGYFNSIPVMVVGQQRGRSTQERIKRNFGMTMPEGNRKAQRLFKLAEKFQLPLILFIDTQGAYPGLDAEARGQAEAIASSLMVLAGLRTPIISIVIGEGGSGGALALGICDRLLMLENSIYSVISPEGCASILWGKGDSDGSSSYAETAAEALKITAQSLLQLGVADDIVREPDGCAHRDHDKAADLLGYAIAKHLRELLKTEMDELLSRRYEKFRKLGVFEGK
ncbi:MAG TPA: acetyl-CoA carboxylase carboxyltransferase subunit alpha [Oligoflexia bacterium]|nr:acetyl-CoA carboxylase carboxyltransferase subunit alpha [Oligoflexia bacterium]HMP49148.1 acetyl-CoA carboxylase carboxyltransferase subunit alpha [Oligoflexia bacterium]